MKGWICAAVLLALLAYVLSADDRPPGVETTQEYLRQHMLAGWVVGKQTTAVTLLRVDQTEYAQQVVKAMIQQLRAQKSHTRGMPVLSANDMDQAAAYIIEHQSTGDAMMFASTAELMQIKEDADKLLQRMKPIACVGVEHNYLIVRADSPINNIEQLIQEMHAGKDIALGWNAQRGRYDEYWVERFLNACDCGNSDNIRRIEIEESIALAILNKEIDVLCVSAYDVLPLLQNGELRALASMAPEQFDIPVLRDVPTLTECGIDLQDGNAYILFCPKEYPLDNENYWREQMMRLLENEDWLLKGEEMCLEVHEGGLIED